MFLILSCGRMHVNNSFRPPRRAQEGVPLSKCRTAAIPSSIRRRQLAFAHSSN